MKQSEIQRLLEAYPYIPEELEKKKEELRQAISDHQEIINTLKAVLITGMPHGSGTSDKTYEAAQAAVDIYCLRIAGIGKEINDLHDMLNKAEKLLALLSPVERKIIDARIFHIRPKPWPVIAKELHFSREHCIRLFEKAIQKMSQKIT
jgi:DNA-directed RNA polymerase sigma subunit (sigma70/sigma32)